MQSPVLAIYCIEILSWTLYRWAGRELFVALGGVNYIMKILYRSHDTDLLNAIGLLLTVAFRDQFLSECFFRAGLDSWLLISQKLWMTCPKLATAADLLFSRYLSLKFEYNGRLDVWDKTYDGFYICKSLEISEDFPLLKDLVARDGSGRTVYYLSLGIPRPQLDDAVSIFDIDNESLEENSAVWKLDFTTSFLDEARAFHKCELKVDTRLKEILEDLQMELQSCAFTCDVSDSEKFSRTWIEKIAKLIGKKVAEAMSGSNHEECSYHTFRLHLRELKIELGTSLIPIGALEVGLKLERAILFKVLADRVDLPCALVRGQHGTAWVELGIPEMSGSQSVFKDMPLRQLVTNHLVDLMDDPGRLIPLESEYAFNYCRIPKDSLVNRFLKKPHLLKPGRPDEQCRGRQLFHIEIE